MGPLINQHQLLRVQSYIDGAHEAGHSIMSGQSVEGVKGFFVSPTIIAGAGGNDPITQEEIFGPVLSIYRFFGIEDLLVAANGTEYGLAATIWSRNTERVFRVAEALHCGKVSVNNAGFPYPGLPEGGYKASGFGRDLGKEAVEQHLQTKSILLSI